MPERINRRRYRTIRLLIRACTAAIICTMIVCTTINVYAAYVLHIELMQVDKQQVDTLNTLMYHRIYTERPREEPEPESLGIFTITHYCPCVSCCGKNDGITYTGTKAKADRTIGVDPDVIPLGSTVYIDGHEYIAEDIGGGISGNRIDMFVDSHDEALQKGVYEAEVFIYGT